MHFQSIQTVIILLLATLVANISTAATRKPKPPPPTPQVPTFSKLHSRSDYAVTYCEQFAPNAPNANKIPKANFKHFDALCKLIPDQLTLPVYDPSATAHCQNFTSGTATAKFCNLDLCKSPIIPNLQQACQTLTKSCFGSKNIPFPYTTAYARFRNAKGYWAFSVNGSTPAIEALEPACNGIPLVNGTMPETPNMEPMLPEPRQWLRDMEALIENKEQQA